MKRPSTEHTLDRSGDIRKDLTESQLAAIGSVALAYNEVEAVIDFLFVIALNLPATVAPEVSSRINGMDGKTEIIKSAMKELGAQESILKTLGESLVRAGLENLKNIGTRSFMREF
jgi:hypothetical protein